MKILLSPLNDETNQLSYEFNGEIITAILNGQSDIFDFSVMPDGVAEDIESTLLWCPIVRAERINGELYVEIHNLIGEDATEEERFPEWKDV